MSKEDRGGLSRKKHKQKLRFQKEQKQREELQYLDDQFQINIKQEPQNMAGTYQ